MDPDVQLPRIVPPETPHLTVIVMLDPVCTMLFVALCSLEASLSRSNNEESDQYTATIFALDVPVFIIVMSVLFLVEPT